MKMNHSSTEQLLKSKNIANAIRQSYHIFFLSVLISNDCSLLRYKKINRKFSSKIKRVLLFYTSFIILVSSFFAKKVIIIVMDDQVNTTKLAEMEIEDQKGTKRQETFDQDMENQKKLKVDEKMEELFTPDYRSELIQKELFDDYNKETRRMLVAGKVTSKIRNVLGTRIEDAGDNYKITYENYSFALTDKEAETTINSKNMLKVILYSASEGLMHFHNKGYTHRNIRPENIVICEENVGYVGKISDLKMSKISTDSKVSKDFDLNPCSAPEIIKNRIKKNVKNKANENQEMCLTDMCPADVFSMGIVFYYALTRNAPFKAIADIRNKSCIVNYDCLSKIYNLEDWDFFLAKQLIKSMLNRNLEKRPTIKQVMNHPFFWNLTKKEHFLMTARQYIKENEPININSQNNANNQMNTNNAIDSENNKIGKALNKKLNIVFANWIDCVDKSLVTNDVGTEYVYKNKASDLLRFLRNFPAHYSERKNENQRKIIGHKGAVSYCLEKIPNLFVHFYSFFKDSPHSEYDTLRKFYCDCHLSNMFDDHCCGDDGTGGKKFKSCEWEEEKI